jgi:hypothetical protein
MKNVISLILFISIVFFGCESEQVEQNEKSIYGTWQLYESFETDGVEGDWIEVDNVYAYEISSNGSFKSSKFQDCNSGTFLLSEQTITFDYECENFTAGIESPPGSFSYLYALKDGQLLLTPNYLMCDEGCGFRFNKIADEINKTD